MATQSAAEMLAYRQVLIARKKLADVDSNKPGALAAYNAAIVELEAAETNWIKSLHK